MKPSYLVVLLLAGCATPTDLRESPPIEWKSSRRADETAGCIASNAAEIRFGPLGLTGTASTRVLGKRAFDVDYHVLGEDLIFTARIEPDSAGGSRVRLWMNQRPLLYGRSAMIQQARRGCE